MPWFGVDIGEILVKVVYFEPTDSIDAAQADVESLATIRRYLTSKTAYGKNGIRDTHLAIKDIEIGGRTGNLHFMRFPTSDVPSLLEWIKSKNLFHVVNTVCATGEEAVKFVEDVKNNFNVKLEQCDEDDCVISGIHLINSVIPNESYYLGNLQIDNEETDKMPYDFQNAYPFLVVNLGSAFTIFSVESKDNVKRVSGSSIGGRTFQGLCCLLTGCQTFEEAMKLTETGDHRKVDQLGWDMYGDGCDDERLPGNSVAYSFGYMADPDKRKLASKNDLARATLVTVVSNIGFLSLTHAKLEGIETIVFVGDFLRANTLSKKLLSNLLKHWSVIIPNRALFLEHEGYFGATGALMELMKKVENGQPSQT